MATGWPLAGNTVPPFQLSLSYMLNAVQTKTVGSVLDDLNCSRVNATNAERNGFNAVRCDLGHTVTGVVLTDDANGARYYFAACSTPHNGRTDDSRAFFVPWPPFYLNSYEA